jgi:response regulator NasT
VVQSRIVIAVDNAVERKKLKDKLQKAGHLVIGQVRDAKETLRVTFQTNPDLVILDAGLPDFGGLGVAQVIDEHRVCPVILLASEVSDIVQRARQGWLLSYLLSPYTDDELYLATEVALANFQRLVALERENTRLKNNLETRKLVDRAKGLLMNHKKLNEQEAYKYLQRLSMDHAKPIARIARQVIEQLAGNGRNGN